VLENPPVGGPESAEDGAHWLERIALPAIERAIADVAPTCEPPLTRLEREEAAADAMIWVSHSPHARTLAATQGWDALRALAEASGRIAALEQCVERFPMEALVPRQPPAPEQKESQPAAGEAFDEEWHEIMRVRALVDSLTDDEPHPLRTVMRLYVQSWQQRGTRQAGSTATQPWAALGKQWWIDLIRTELRDTGDPPTAQQRRLMQSIASVLRAEQVASATSTDQTRRAAVDWAWGEFRRARRLLRLSYYRRYGTAPRWL